MLLGLWVVIHLLPLLLLLSYVVLQSLLIRCLGLLLLLLTLPLPVVHSVDIA
jgi:hypothetical protein